ncbi:MAG: hypothetical protein ACFCVG_09395 [Kineosporiaceae bacterium]
MSITIRDEQATRAAAEALPPWPRVRAVADGNAVFVPMPLIYETSLPGRQRQVESITTARDRYRA